MKASHWRSYPPQESSCINVLLGVTSADSIQENDLDTTPSSCPDTFATFCACCKQGKLNTIFIVAAAQRMDEVIPSMMQYIKMGEQ